MHASPIVRRISRQIMVGNVAVGGDAPVTVQTMTLPPGYVPVSVSPLPAATPFTVQA